MGLHSNHWVWSLHLLSGQCVTRPSISQIRIRNNDHDGRFLFMSFISNVPCNLIGSQVNERLGKGEEAGEVKKNK